MNILKLEMEKKKKEIDIYIRNFFDEFSEIDSKVFSDLKNSIHENEANMINSMESIKSNVSKYFGETQPGKDNNMINHQYQFYNNENNKKETKNQIHPIKLSKEKFDEIDKATNGMMSIQINKQDTLNNLFGELKNIK